jgi:uncharacterized protein YvpB
MNKNLFLATLAAILILTCSHPSFAARDYLWVDMDYGSFAGGTFKNTELQEIRKTAGDSEYPRVKLALARRENGNFHSEGNYTSKIYRTASPVTEAILSWNSKTPPGTQMRFELRAKLKNGRWTEWYYFGIWGIKENFSRDFKANTRDDDGRVRIDYLTLNQSATHLQYRIDFKTDDSNLSPSIYRITVAHTDYSRPERRTGHRLGKPTRLKSLNIPFRSQMWVPDIGNVICCPTSLSMVLEYYGHDFETAEVAAFVRDYKNRKYGNWIFTSAGASEYGLETWVQRFRRWKPVERLVSQGIPVILSVSNKSDTIKEGDPYSNTSGHVIVLRGFTEDGRVVVNDPGRSHIEDGIRILTREDLKKAWLDVGGAAIIVRQHSRFEP